MNAATVLVLLALAPALCWCVGLAAVGVRHRLRVRGDEGERRDRLARLLVRSEVSIVPTADVDLSEAEVREVADAAGYRLLGYERAGFLRRRCGVFLRAGGAVEAIVGGGPGR